MSLYSFLCQVTLVGLVKSVNESPTRIDYVIDDMTGPPLDVRRFNDSDVSLDFVCIVSDSNEKDIANFRFKCFATNSNAFCQNNVTITKIALPCINFLTTNIDYME